MINNRLALNLVKHYISIFIPEHDSVYHEFLFDNIFKTDKFLKMLDCKADKLFLFYTENYESKLVTNPLFKTEDFICATKNWDAPIWDFRYGAILCSSQEALNLVRITCNVDDDFEKFLDLSPMMQKIYTHLGDNNV